MIKKSFSRYDKSGNVIYSETKSVGEIVRHFYSYDENNRRIEYKSESSNGNMFEEHTEYHDNGYKNIITYRIPEHVYIKKMYNSDGRMIEQTIVNNINGDIIYSTYNYITDKYDVHKTKTPFTYDSKVSY